MFVLKVVHNKNSTIVDMMLSIVSGVHKIYEFVTGFVYKIFRYNINIVVLEYCMRHIIDVGFNTGDSS